MFVADLSKVNSPVMRHILSDGRQPWFKREDFEKAREFFAANPESVEVLCFYDGHLEDAQKYVRRTHHSNPYIASVVAIGEDGIPLPISRNALEVWKWQDERK